tara:strand:+ start:85 stop:348 length:264 start_codon:yes stop_codon:yes gene_type:complete
MKKIKLLVASLLLGGMCYGQSPCDSVQINVNKFKSVEYRIMDLIDAIRMDMYYGHLDRERGMYYINEILKVKSVNRDIMAGIRNETY